MTSENKNRDAFDLESALREDHLLRLRRAYNGWRPINCLWNMTLKK